MKDPAVDRVWHAAVIAALVAGLLSCSGPAPQATSQAQVGESATGAEATEEAGAVATLPDTPAGRQMAWMVAAADGGEVTVEEVAAHFTQGFAEVVDPAQIRAMVVEVHATAAPLVLSEIDADSTENDLIAYYSAADRSVLRAHVVTESEPPHLIDGFSLRPAFWLHPDLPRSWEAVEAELRSQASWVNLSAAEIVDDGLRPIYEVDADRPLGVGSSFKLYVLSALADEVIGGRHSWDETLAVNDAWKAIPTGVMQHFEEGTPVTLREYAEKMISISDNTATDHLIHLVGRETVVEAMARAGNAHVELNEPMPTVREFSWLKLFGTPELMEEYTSASTERRLEILEQASADFDYAAAVFAAAFWLTPRRIDVLEWFASARDLNRVMRRLWEQGRDEAGAAVFEILSLNPGVGFDRDVWAYVGYKGGSEPGVMNMNWLLERQDHRVFVLSMGLNDPEHEIELEPALLVAVGAINQLAAE
jgi:hypothetical protein